MDVKRVLGSERCYLMSDGSKVPFAERDRIFGKKRIIEVHKKIEPVSVNDADTILNPTKGKKKKFRS